LITAPRPEPVEDDWAILAALYHRA